MNSDLNPSNRNQFNKLYQLTVNKNQTPMNHEKLPPKPKTTRNNREKDLLNHYHKKQARLQKLRAEQNIRLNQEATGIPKINKAPKSTCKTKESVIVNESVLSISVNLMSMSSSEPVLAKQGDLDASKQDLISPEKSICLDDVSYDHLSDKSYEDRYFSLTPKTSKIGFKSGCNLNAFLARAKPMIDYKKSINQ